MGKLFRRISRNKRKFACVYADELIVKNDKFLDKAHCKWRELEEDGEIESQNCLCPRHKPSVRVDWRNKKPEMELYVKIGSIKNKKLNKT